MEKLINLLAENQEIIVVVGAYILTSEVLPFNKKLESNGNAQLIINIIKKILKSVSLTLPKNVIIVNRRKLLSLVSTGLPK